MKILNNLLRNALEVKWKDHDKLIKAKKGVDQFTKDLGPCIAVSFYDFERDESYMVHTPRIRSIKFEEMIRQVKEKFGENVIVQCCGASLKSKPFDEGYNGSILNDRKYAEDLLNKNFPKIIYQWSKVDNLADIYLNKKQKTFRVSIE